MVHICSLLCLINKDHRSNAKIFDTLVSWLKLDPFKIEEYLCDTDNLNELLSFLFNFSYTYGIQEYFYVLNSLKIIISISDRIGTFISNKKEIVQKIVKQLYELKNSGMIKREFDKSKKGEGSRSGVYYSQSSAHLEDLKNPYNIQFGHNLIQVLRDLLEIIVMLIEKSKYSPKKFVEKYKLEPVLVQINQLAKTEHLVILDGISEKLLDMLFEASNP